MGTISEQKDSRIRIDKWLWAARFFKTRSLAVDELGKHRILVNGQPAKASREVHVGDRVEIRQGTITRTVVVRVVSNIRGPAPVAQTLYEETPESAAAREEATRQHPYTCDPAEQLASGRPTKRDRRKLAEWDRWSARHEP